MPLEALAGKLAAQVGRIYSGRPGEIEAAVTSAAAVLSMRLHLSLLAVAHGVPVGGIAYDPKVAQQGDMHGFPTTPLDAGFDASSVRLLLGPVA